MGVSPNYITILLAIKQITILLRIDNAGDKVLISGNHQSNLTTRC